MIDKLLSVLSMPADQATHIVQRMILVKISTCSKMWYRSGTSRYSLIGKSRTVSWKHSLYPLIFVRWHQKT